MGRDDWRSLSRSLAEVVLSPADVLNCESEMVPGAGRRRDCGGPLALRQPSLGTLSHLPSRRGV